jgi:hypothetical protein
MVIQFRHFGELRKDAKIVLFKFKLGCELSKLKFLGRDARWGLSAKLRAAKRYWGDVGVELVDGFDLLS